MMKIGYYRNGGKYMCGKCGQHHSQKSNLVRHMTTVECADKNFEPDPGYQWRETEEKICKRKDVKNLGVRKKMWAIRKMKKEVAGMVTKAKSGGPVKPKIFGKSKKIHMKESKPTRNGGPITRKIKMETMEEKEEKMFEEAKENGRKLQMEMPREEAFDELEGVEGKAGTEPENETLEEDNTIKAEPVESLLVETQTPEKLLDITLEWIMADGNAMGMLGTDAFKKFFENICKFQLEQLVDGKNVPLKFPKADEISAALDRNFAKIEEQRRALEDQQSRIQGLRQSLKK